ncbi:MerR family transcriptional regulator [Streptomyces kanamyceticus]|uniref:MerR family transcriptional regulator n=1 Tax=Streptomyces kanamyceticus TaxID=1967 RepID=A0A5J6G4D4_STRKN|nr:MerR family transcriptional regulator [Streptomyces kanamyceticus]QEU89767.1 MerR family transcriptional regulator [Streptomyces kanamyceticus]
MSSERAGDGAPSPAMASVTTGALARHLGVSPTTLRSWDQRYGVGPATRSDGAHRRWTPKDIAVLEEMCRLTASGVAPAEAARSAKTAATPPSSIRPSPGGRPSAVARPASVDPAPEPADVRRARRGLIRAAVRLDSPAVDHLLSATIARHGLVVAWEELMVPALHAVGRKWESAGDRYVEVEHLLSWHIQTALRRVTSTTAEADPAPPVVLACVPGEQHSLALDALTAALAERGRPLRMFGAALPVPALTAAVRRIGPCAVVLWSQARSTASVPLAQHVAAARWGVKGARGRPAVILAGPGWSGQAVKGARRPLLLHEALTVLTELSPRTAPAGGTPGPP